LTLFLKKAVVYPIGQDSDKQTPNNNFLPHN